MLFDIDFDVSVDQVTPVALSLEAIREVEQFIYHEARLLDERRWQAWLDLWTEEGMYWIPHSYDQESPYEHISLCWENKLLRELRIRRLENHRNWSQQPITQSCRVLGNVMIDGTHPEGYLVVRSSF
ncbi:aromatic-ring-hydroxylating dioxygenase subunit beta, partial [Pseudomonas aeruginosa]|uniref:aromatic-ring-hydroxylating dioxygenase subunit beta n=1 Tax=Pseudomonas aeruginosa TaxID=287 RepID=UPI00071B217F